MPSVICDHGRRSRSDHTGVSVRVSQPPPGWPRATARAPVPGRRSDAKAIQALDPLQGDEALARVPEMNARANTRALLRLANDLIPTESAIDAFSLAHCIAAMRDLGIVAGSLKRHGIDPISELPGLGPAMADLGRRSDMVARDTVYHYTEWNPPGDRRRRYTGDRQEHELQHSVTLCLPELRAAVERCRRLKLSAATDREFGLLATELAGHVRTLVTMIDQVRATVSPEYFARGLRPYFEDITVAGEVLLGPAAAHIPLGLIDLALWASDSDGDRYASFCAESARYNPPAWRRLYRIWADGPSLVTRVLEAAAESRSAESSPIDLGVRGLRDTLRAIVVFRGRHLSLARKAYAEDVRLYTMGSGGGSLDLLSEIVLLTRRNAACLRRTFGDA
jgi:monodechloroaminopyrrolnitrin synthase